MDREWRAGRIDERGDSAASRHVHGLSQNFRTRTFSRGAAFIDAADLPIRHPVWRCGPIGWLDVNAAALHAIHAEDEIDTGGTHVHALHGVPAKQTAVERKPGLVVAGRKLVPREGAERRDSNGLGPRIFRIDD